MIETRPYSEEHRLSNEQYSTLNSYIEDFTSELPTVLRIVERIYPDYFIDDSDEESYEFAVELNIGDRGSVDETTAENSILCRICSGHT